MVLYHGCTVCVVEGWSIIEVIKVNVANIKAGGGERKQQKEEEGGGGMTLPLKYKKWNLKDQTLTNDVVLLGTTMLSDTFLSPSLSLLSLSSLSFYPLSQPIPLPLPLTISVRPVTWLVLMPPFVLLQCLRLNSSQ